MKFTATEAQLREVAALAYNASRPEGLGFLQYVEGDVRSVDLGHIKVINGFHHDYVQGRKIRLTVRRESDGAYSVPDADPSIGHQTWAWRYPSYRALLKAAGVSVEVAA